MYLIISLASLIVSFYTTKKLIPLCINFGFKYNFLDTPDKRKQHKKPLVRIGGIAIFLGFLISFFIVYVLSNIYNFNLGITTQLNYFFFITISFFIVGLLDDFLNLSPILRLIYQLSISSFVWFKGLRVESINLPLLNNETFVFELPLIISLIITVVWIVGITNSINWIDGLDGLASGIVFFSLSSFFLICIFLDNKVSVLLIPPILGSTLGFLKYNFYPSKILMGDCGSLFLGSSLAFMSLLSISTNYSSVSSYIKFYIFYPILIVGVPCFDMFYVIFARLIEKNSPFYPDRKHIHHRILNFGLSHKKTVLAIYSMQIILCVLPILIFFKTLSI